MDLHQNARLTLRSRELLARYVLEDGFTRKAAAAAFRVSARTAGKWVGRFQQDGREGLMDRSSRPRRSPRQVAEPIRQRVVELRRERKAAFWIARETGLSTATVSRILRRARLSLSLIHIYAAGVPHAERRHPGRGAGDGGCAARAPAHRLRDLGRQGVRQQGQREGSDQVPPDEQN